MLDGKCPKCGENYYGWALRFVRNRYCNICGAALEITEDGNPLPGYSPFDAEEYRVRDGDFSDSTRRGQNPERN